MSHIPAERCLDIIELLADGAVTLPLGEIAERLELPKSGAHRLLATLVDLGWAEQDPDTSYYRLTMRLAVLGQRFYAATGVPDICQPILDRLARQCGEFARLSVVDGDSLVWVAQAQGARSGLLYQPTLNTNVVPLHTTATGKAWLATLPVDVAMKVVLKAGINSNPRTGPNAVKDVGVLMREVKATAKRGYGIAVNEAEPGVSAIAAAIVPEAGGVAVGTVSIAGPSARMTDGRLEEVAAGLVVPTAAELAKIWPARPRRPAPPAAAAHAKARTTT
jgi:IclR family acetate operon transcriptional repressor